MRIVVKVGSSVLSKPNGELDRLAVERIASQIGKAHREGHEMMLVTSGAIAAGVGRLGLKERPTDLRLKQAAAAVGQLVLMEAYEQAFSRDSLTPAQILLTREDLIHHQRYLNARNTLLNLMSLKTIPIINENDSVSTVEIQFGDNDELSAVVAAKVEADKLILLSNVPGLYEQDEKGNLTSRIIPVVERITAEMEKKTTRKEGSKMSVGGMSAKLSAAKMATAAGVETWIASGCEEGVIEKILKGEEGAGTRFKPQSKKLASRRAWIAFGRTPKGSLVIDDGALRAIVDHGKSLLPAGIKAIRGEFTEGDMVGVKSSQGTEMARGLVNFSAKEIKLIRGRHSKDVAQILGRDAAGEVIHRDNLVLL
jgi:glutamate 5-kinase